jgi:hypothetical protein
MKRILLFLFLTGLGLFISIYVFNHINSWAGLAGVLLTAYIAVSEFLNQLKKEINKQN